MNRDLDAQVVKTIFKWRYIPVSSDAKGENKCQILYPTNEEPDQDFYNMLPRIGNIHEGWVAPRYSSDIIKAIELAKHVKLPMTVSELPLDPEILTQKCLEWHIRNDKNKI